MMARKTAVEALASEQFDLLVIGGGITGILPTSGAGA